MSNKNTRKMGGQGTQLLSDALAETAAAAAGLEQQDDDGKPRRKLSKAEKRQLRRAEQARREQEARAAEEATEEGDDEGEEKEEATEAKPLSPLAQHIRDQQEEARLARERHAAAQAQTGTTADAGDEDEGDGPDATEKLPPTSVSKPSCGRCKFWVRKMGEPLVDGHHPHCPNRPKTKPAPKEDEGDGDEGEQLLPANTPLSAGLAALDKSPVAPPVAAPAQEAQDDGEEGEEETPVIAPPPPAPKVPVQVWADPKQSWREQIRGILLAAVPEAAKKRIRVFAVGIMASVLLFIAAIWWFGFLSTMWTLFVGGVVCLAYAFVGEHIHRAVVSATTLALRLKLGARVGLFVLFTGLLLALPWGPGFGWVTVFAFLWLMAEVMVLNLRLDAKPQVEVEVTRTTTSA